jgi:hypothetical protein
MVSRKNRPPAVFRRFTKLWDAIARWSASSWQSVLRTVSHPVLPVPILVTIAGSLAFALLLHASSDIVAGVFAIGVVTAIIESRLRR